MDHSLIQRGLGTVPSARMAKGGAQQFAKKKNENKKRKKKKKTRGEEQYFAYLKLTPERSTGSRKGQLSSWLISSSSN